MGSGRNRALTGPHRSGTQSILPAGLDSDTSRSTESIFISDLHLAPDRPATVERLIGFLDGRARQAHRLYILGDLFDVWIGDDDDTPAYLAVRAALRRLTASGTACSFLRGNRDFLLGRRFCRDTGCIRLRDPALVQFDGERTLLMHGDLLCTDDLAYQRFRRRIRNPLVIRLFLFRSLARRRAIAADYRGRSRTATADKPEGIMDVSVRTLTEYLRRFRATRLIHGHTHRPGDHRLMVDGHPRHRAVLAEWTGDRGEALVHTPGTWRRETV